MNVPRATTRTLIAVLMASCAAVASADPANAADALPLRVIRAGGDAVVKAAPDRARVTVSVTTRAVTARQASEANANASKSVLEKLRAAIRPPGEVRTAGYELNAEYNYNQGGATSGGPRLVGYASTNRFVIVTADLAAVGALIDSAVAAGANQVDSISFFLDDEVAPRHQALLEAGRKAKAEAATIAESLGVTLGDLLEASTNASAAPIPVYGREKAMMAAPAAAATDVVPGSLDIGASVTATFAIR